MNPTYKDVPDDNSVAVIIISHDYGKYLEECIDSLLSQTVRPFECVVIADNCSIEDRTVSIAKDYGLRCLQVDNRNVHANRKLGLEYTRSPYVIYLDADDWLKPTYIASCLSVLQSRTDVAIVTTHLDRGDDIQYHEPVNINRRNWLHAGSMVRRTALISSEAFSVEVPHQTHADWFLWRKIINDGWLGFCVAKPLYFYRQHGNNMLSGVLSLPYYDYANLALEPITVVIPICRDRYWPRLEEWLLNNHVDYDKIVIIDSTQSTSNEIQRFLSYICKDTVYLRRQSNDNLADRDRNTDAFARLEVQETMCKIYKPLRGLSNEYLFILEDDVLPPNGAITKLLQQFDHNVAAVSGVVRSRYCPNKRVIAGMSFTEEGESLDIRSANVNGLQQVAYTGFGCLLLRRSSILSVKPFVTGNYDMEFFSDVAKTKLKVLLNWNVDCVHGSIEEVK